MERFSDVCTLVGFLNLNKKEKKSEILIQFLYKSKNAIIKMTW